MHLEILIEDLSGKRMLEELLPKLINDDDTFKIHPYKGVGHIPKNMTDTKNAGKRMLLENLPKLLKGYGRTFSKYPGNLPAAVVVVCDLDDKPLREFLAELNAILQLCHPAPEARFTIAIEEGEAWLLGDIPAVMSAFPHAKEEVLNSYVNDSICGTWELLADAVYPGGRNALSGEGWQAVGAEKYRWADVIAPLLDVEANKSPSFTFFRDTLHALVGTPKAGQFRD